MFVSVMLVRGILSELRDRDIDPEEVLRVSELSRERISDIREYVSLDELERLIDHAIAASGDPGLGLLVGAHAPETMLQVLGHWIVAHSTIREAFASWQECSALLTDAAKFQLLERGELAIFSCEPCVVTPSLRFLMDLTLAVTVRIGAHFARGWNDLHEVHFRHAVPSYAPHYRDVFRCPVRFGREHNALIFRRELLDRPQLYADETVRSVLHEAVQRLLRERNQARTLRERVRHLLQNPEELARTDGSSVALRMGVTPRTLRRRLAVEGTTLATLIDEARCRFACQALRRGDASKLIAEQLEFSEPSAFHRAFKRWTGLTPTEYARNAGAERRVSPRWRLRHPPLTSTQSQAPVRD